MNKTEIANLYNLNLTKKVIHQSESDKQINEEKENKEGGNPLYV